MTDAVRELIKAARAVVENDLPSNDPLYPQHAAVIVRASALRSALATIESQAASEVCKWELQPGRELATNCAGAAFTGQNSFTYCPDCGRKIEVCHE